MNYCQEIAVLQSALLLTNKQIKVKKKKSKSDIRPCVAVLYGAVEEICLGLEKDRELEEQETWGQQLFSILLYKVISTHYNDMVPGDDVGIKPGNHVDKMEALCAVLPPVNNKVFLEVIKRCGWYQLFFNSLILVQERVASSLLCDIVSHICEDEIDNNDLTWGKLIINYFVGNLITTTKTTGRPSNKDEANQSGSLKTKPIDISSQAASSQSTSANGQESSNDNVRDICSTGESDVCGGMTLTYMCSILKMITHCQNTAKSYTTNSENLPELDNKNETLCGLCQFLLLGVCFCPKSPVRFDQISDWMKSNVFGCDVHDHSQNFTAQSFGRYSCTTMLERDIGLDSELMNTSSEVFPWKCWIENIRNILNSETIQNITADIDNMKPLESTVSFCNFVPLVPKGVNSGKMMFQFLSLGCSISKVLTMAAQVLQGVQEFNRQNIDTDQEETLTFSKDLEIIVESLYSILKVSQPDVDSHVISFTSDWSLSAILWRIENQQPGYKDGFSRLLTTFHTEVWSNLSLMKTIQDNINVLLTTEVMPKFYDLVAKLFDDMDPDLVCQLKQLALAGFSCLPWTVQDHHIALVYSSYRHWPRHHGGQLDGIITTTLNKLTMEVTENEKVISELCQLALQDVETVIKGIVGRAASSAQQANISIKVLMRMASVASGRTDGCSLCDVLHQYLESSQLSAKECCNILYFIQLSVQKSSDCGDTQRATPLLKITRFIQNTALPYLSVSCIFREETLNTVFALEIILCILEALKHHKALLVSVLESLATDSASWLLCVAELWQCCVILWESDLDTGVKLKLKENLVKFSTLLKSTNASCELCNYDPQSSDWLYGHLEQLDWSVQLRMAEVVSPKMYLQESELEKLCLILSSKSGDYQDLFRIAAVSDMMMETVAKLITKHESNLLYEEVVVCFAQMLPHFVYKEWKRVTLLTLRILDVGYLVPQHHDFNQGDMGTQTRGLVLLLNMSQLMHDIMLVLQFTTLVTVKAGLLHCTKCYVGVIKECVLAGGADLTMLEQSILLTEVFNHICHATQWMPLETLDPADVLLLDVVCSLEQLKNDLDMNMFGKTFTDKLKCLTQSSASVKNPDTKNMLEKKITVILNCGS
ncbi:uncharacterized protein [Argopecten irradians]|uniref:uncharacterized protein isoform X2 n=1 Tax=Argopecten irradians TaxID=31199 RepID=UPI00371A5FE0